jgi:hypothetical protein
MAAANDIDYFHTYVQTALLTAINDHWNGLSAAQQAIYTVQCIGMHSIANNHHQYAFFNNQTRCYAYFSSLSARSLLFPSIAQPARFDLTRHGDGSRPLRDFSYYGREVEFQRMMDFVNELLYRGVKFSKMHIRGMRGSGKSHLLACLALVMHLMRHQGGNDAVNYPHLYPRCVYLPTLNVNSAWNDFKDAVALALENPNLRSMPDQVFIAAVGAVNNFHLLFILDDWNKFSLLSSEMKHLFNSCISSHQTYIFGHSSRSGEIPQTNKSTYFINSGLTNNEWNFWRDQGSYGLVRDRIVNNNEGNHEFLFATGRNPLVLKIMSNELSNYTVAERDAMAFKDVVDLFCRSDVEGGGRYMLQEISSFFGKLGENRDTLKRSIQLMADSMIGKVISNNLENHLLYPLQFFTMTKNTHGLPILEPVCGIVCYYVKEYLREFERNLFRNSFNLDWVTAGLSHTNSSIRGFCFEAYCLAHIDDIIAQHTTILQDFKVEKDFIDVATLKVKDISGGDIPLDMDVSGTDLPGGYFFVPKKWNCRYVDAVLKLVKVELKKRPKRKTTWLIPIQITVRNPTQKANCLNFYTNNGDYTHYLTPGDSTATGPYAGPGNPQGADYGVTFERKFLWIARAATTPPAPNAATHQTFRQYSAVVR